MKNRAHVTHIHYQEDFNDFNLGCYPYKYIIKNKDVSFLFRELYSWVGKDILNKAIEIASQHVSLTGGAPGEDFWESIKSLIVI